MIWEEAIGVHLERMRARHLASGTCQLVASHLERFARFCQSLGVDLPAAVTASHLAAFRQHLVWRASRRKLPSPATVTSVLWAVRAFLRALVAEGQLLVDPARDLVLPQPPRHLPRLLSVEEVQGMLAHPDPRRALGLRDRALLELLYGTGIRREECRRLNLADVDRSQNVVRVQWTKNRQARFLPLGPHLVEALAAYLEDGRARLVRRHPEQPALFVSCRGQRLGLYGITNIVADTAHALGLGRVTPHSLRHAFATHLLAGGADVLEVQAMLGHVRLASTQTYTHLQPLEVFAEHLRTHPRARAQRSPERT